VQSAGDLSMIGTDPQRQIAYRKDFNRSLEGILGPYGTGNLGSRHCGVNIYICVCVIKER